MPARDRERLRTDADSRVDRDRNPTVARRHEELVVGVEVELLTERRAVDAVVRVTPWDLREPGGGGGFGGRVARHLIDHTATEGDDRGIVDGDETHGRRSLDQDLVARAEPLLALGARMPAPPAVPGIPVQVGLRAERPRFVGRERRRVHGLAQRASPGIDNLHIRSRGEDDVIVDGRPYVRDVPSFDGRGGLVGRVEARACPRAPGEGEGELDRDRCGHGSSKVRRGRMVHLTSADPSASRSPRPLVPKDPMRSFLRKGAAAPAVVLGLLTLAPMLGCGKTSGRRALGNLLPEPAARLGVRLKRMVVKPRTALATYADIESLPKHMVGEIVRGALHANPRPAGPHAVTASALGEELGPPFRRGRGGPGGWVILDEPELHLAEEIVVPDLAGWRRERHVDFEAAYFADAPDWLCEVLSKSTEALDRTEKMPLYATHHVLHVWLANPTVKTLEVYRLDGSTYRRVAAFAGDAMVRAEPFDAVELDLSALWTP